MKKNVNLVELRPLPKKKWHGYEGQLDFAQGQSSSVLYDPSTGKYATGLTKEEADEWGEELGLDLSDKFNPEQGHPYWDSRAARLDFPNKTLILDSDKLLDKIKIKNYKAHKYCANSQKEYDEGKWPEATHILFDASEEVEAEAIKVSKKRKAYKLADKLTKEQKINIIQLVKEFSARSQSNDFIDVQIDEIIEQNLEDFLKYASMKKEDIRLRGIVVEGIYKNVLTKEGASIFYLSDLLGHSVDDVVEYFSDPQNQEIKARILEKILT